MDLTLYEQKHNKARHWSDFGRNPIGSAAQQFVHEKLLSCYRGRFPSYTCVMTHFTRNKTVLDIGVVEHAREMVDRPGWKHRVIRGLARRAVGCDILEPEVAYLQSQGFDIRLVDATSSQDLGERFEIVYIGDVIEHVNDASKLLVFAARHLDVDGRIVVTTPCPFWYKNLIACLTTRPFIGNVDHVDWITPFNALELAHRASISLDSYYLVQNLGHGPITRLAHRLRDSIGLRDTELLSWAYVYVFAAAPDDTSKP